MRWFYQNRHMKCLFMVFIICIYCLIFSVVMYSYYMQLAYQVLTMSQALCWALSQHCPI